MTTEPSKYNPTDLGTQGCALQRRRRRAVYIDGLRFDRVRPTVYRPLAGLDSYPSCEETRHPLCANCANDLLPGDAYRAAAWNGDAVRVHDECVLRLASGAAAR